MKCLDKLVTNSPEEIANQIEFFQSVDLILEGSRYANLNDLAILVKCLNVYQTTGINYFPRYEEFIKNTIYSPLDEGIRGFSNAIISSRYTIDMFKEEIQQRIEDMDFFSFSKVKGLTKDDYKALLIDCEKEYYAIIEENNRIVIKEKEVKLKELSDKYLNFEEFDMEVFEQHFEKCVATLTNQTYTIDQLSIKMNLTEASQVYLVVMFLNNVAIKVGKTRQVLLWAMKNVKEYDQATFGLYLVDENYANELRVKICLHFNTIPVNAGMVEASNKVYANLNQAKRVYGHLYEITLPRLRKIMSLSGITQRQFGPITILEKTELDQHVRRYLKLNANKKSL